MWLAWFWGPDICSLTHTQMRRCMSLAALLRQACGLGERIHAEGGLTLLGRVGGGRRERARCGAAPVGRSGHSGLLLQGGQEVVQRQAHGVPLQRRGAAQRGVCCGHLPAAALALLTLMQQLSLASHLIA